VYYDAEGFSDRVCHRIGLAGSAQYPRGATAEIRAMNPRAAFRLVLAGRILRLRGHVIACKPDEAYPVAVLRVLLALPDDMRAVLRSEVDFLESLGPYGAPSETIRERWAERLPDPLPGDG
jgi:hypothetical protein